jgi:multimeric flavodoxin WrbA
MSRILIVYYSRSGYTQRAAEALAERLDATLLPIEEARSRRGIFGYWRSAWEALRRIDADIALPATNPADFDLVLIGTPVWASRPSSPARTFAGRHRGLSSAPHCSAWVAGRRIRIGRVAASARPGPAGDAGGDRPRACPAPRASSTFAATLRANLAPPAGLRRP